MQQSEIYHRGKNINIKNDKKTDKISRKYVEEDFGDYEEEEDVEDFENDDGEEEEEEEEDDDEETTTVIKKGKYKGLNLKPIKFDKVKVMQAISDKALSSDWWEKIKNGKVISGTLDTFAPTAGPTAKTVAALLDHGIEYIAPLQKITTAVDFVKNLIV